MYIYIIYLKEDVPRWLTEYEKKIGIRQEENQKRFSWRLDSYLQWLIFTRYG